MEYELEKVVGKFPMDIGRLTAARRSLAAFAKDPKVIVKMSRQEQERLKLYVASLDTVIEEQIRTVEYASRALRAQHDDAKNPPAPATEPVVEPEAPPPPAKKEKAKK